MMPYSFRPAAAPDASKVAELVDAAYGHYVERIGVLPGPMTDDYAEVIGTHRVTLAEQHGAVVGVIVLAVTDEGFLVDNVAVHPGHRGRGLGRALLEFAEAEARRAGFEDRVRRIRAALPGRVLARLLAETAWMSGREPAPGRGQNGMRRNGEL